jgi:hypothetical protein
MTIRSTFPKIVLLAEAVAFVEEALAQVQSEARVKEQAWVVADAVHNLRYNT